MRTLGILIAALAVAAPVFCQKKSIFIITDAEGVAGICRQEQTDTKDPELRQLLTGEVNAAVDGFLAGGADEVVVWDGHGGSATLSLTTMHPQAKLMTGSIGVSMTLDRGYAGVAFVGQHSMANVRNGVMAHSYSSLGIQNLKVNGKPVGEIETRAAIAGAFGIPVLLLTGDQAAAAELHAIVPQAETAVVKEGLGRYSCVSLPAAQARSRIRDAAARAMKKLGVVRPFRIEGPVTIEIEHTTRNSLAPDADKAAGAEIVDDRTIRFKGRDFLDAWTRARLW
jgi:D-amino peptidase